MEPLEISMVYSYSDFCNLFEKLNMNYGKEILLKIVFRIFDYDGDDKITLHDLMSLMSHNESVYLSQDFEVINNILRSQKSPFKTEDESVETEWITSKDWKEFNLNKNKQNKIREECFEDYYHQLVKAWEIEEMKQKVEELICTRSYIKYF